MKTRIKVKQIKKYFQSLLLPIHSKFKLIDVTYSIDSKWKMQYCRFSVEYLPELLIGINYDRVTKKVNIFADWKGLVDYFKPSKVPFNFDSINDLSLYLQKFKDISKHSTDERNKLLINEVREHHFYGYSEVETDKEVLYSLYQYTYIATCNIEEIKYTVKTLNSIGYNGAIYSDKLGVKSPITLYIHMSYEECDNIVEGYREQSRQEYKDNGFVTAYYASLYPITDRVVSYKRKKLQKGYYRVK